MQKNEVDKATSMIRKNITLSREMVEIQNPQSQVIDPIEQIKKLKELADLDIISKEEFETKKTELLSKI